MKDIFKKIHLWVSVPFGIVIAITCFTGALLVFEDEITALCCGDVASVEPTGETLSIDDIVTRVEPTLSDGVEVIGVVVSSSPDRAYEITLSKPRKASVYVNQYTGEVIGGNERLPFFTTVFRLHRWLMDSNPGEGKLFWGRIIVGTSTLLFVVILLTGVVIWWPRNRKMLKNRLQIAVKKGKNRFWYDLHVAGGIYAVLFLLVMALTGLTWSFEWYKDGVYDLLDAETSDASYVPVKKAGTDEVMLTEALADDAGDTCIGDCGKCKLDVCVYAQPSGDDAVSSAEWSADAVSGATAVERNTEVCDEEPSLTDALSGATTVDANSGATTVDANSSATTVDANSGATVVDANSGAITVVDANSGATAVDSSAGIWQVAFENVVAMVPEYSQLTVSDGAVSVRCGGFGNQRASDIYIYDKETGEVISSELYADSAAKTKVQGWIYSLHVGSWGGVVTRVLAFLAALLGATLPLTGYWLWIRRLYLKKKKN